LLLGFDPPARTATSPLLLHKFTQIPSIFFRRPADLALAFARIETGGLILEPLDFFGGGDVDIIADGLAVLHTVVEEGGDFDPPFFGLRFDIVFVADADIFGGFGAETIVLDLAFVAGFCRFGPGFEETDGPEVFVEADFFFAGHMFGGGWAGRLLGGWAGRQKYW
jgi:hypothetical protein